MKDGVCFTLDEVLQTFGLCKSLAPNFCLVLQGANPDLQDTNGNTVTHMMVIYDKMVS